MSKPDLTGWDPINFSGSNPIAQEEQINPIEDTPIQPEEGAMQLAEEAKLPIENEPTVGGWTPIGGGKAPGGWEPIKYTPSKLPTNKSKKSQGDSEWDEMGKFHQFLDILGRPGYAIKADIAYRQDDMFEKAKSGEMDMSGGQMKDMFQFVKEDLKTRANVGPRLQSMWGGFSGQERNTMNNILEKIGISGVPMLGFASELVVDPTMYTGSAIPNAVGWTVKGTGKVLQQIPGVTKATTAVGKTIEPAVIGIKESGSRIMRAFSTRTPFPFLNRAYDILKSKVTGDSVREIEFGSQINRAIRSVSKKHGKTVDETSQEIIRIIESNGEVLPTHLDMVPLVNSIKSHLDNIIIGEQKAGLAVKGLGASDQVAINKSRNLLDQARVKYGKELQKRKAWVEKDLEKAVDKKVKAWQKKLGKKEAAIRSKGLVANKKKLLGHIKQSKEIHNKLIALEEALRNNQKLGIATDNIENVIKELERKYWVNESHIGEYLTSFPEDKFASKYLNQLEKIEDELASGLDVRLGGKANSSARELAHIETQTGKLPTTMVGKGNMGIGLPAKHIRKVLKELYSLRSKKQLGYFPRVITKKAAEKFAKSIQIGIRRAWNTDLKNAIRRKTGNYTLEEFNDVIRTNGYKGAESIDEFFTTDIGLAVSTRGLKSVKAVSSAEFLTGLAKKFGTKIGIKLPEETVKRVPQLKGVKFDPAIHHEIMQVTKSYINPQELTRVGQTYDVILNYWKKWTLVLFPKYHLRNGVGNLWNNSLAGVDPKTYMIAASLQMYKAFRNGNKVFGRMKDPRIAERARSKMYKMLDEHGLDSAWAGKILKEAEDLGVVNKGFVNSDVSEEVTKRAMKGMHGQSMFSKIKHHLTGESSLEAGQAVGTIVENNARLAHFVDRILKGDGPVEAAMSVKKYLFDYTDLTQFEKQIMKRVVPFYTWTRKNIPLQLEKMIEDPRRAMAIGTMKRDEDPREMERLASVNPQLSKRLPVKMGQEGDVASYIQLEGLLPIGDLMQIMRIPKEIGEGGTPSIVTDMIAPILKYGLERTFKTELYSNRPIENYSGETKLLFGQDVPAYWHHAIKTIIPQARLINTIDKIIWKKEGKEPLTTQEELLSQSLVTVYKMNIKDIRDIALYNLSKKAQALKKGARNAKRKGRDTEVSRIMSKEVSKIMEEFKRIR